MKKKFIVFLLLIIMLSGCGNTGADNESVYTAGEAAEQTDDNEEPESSGEESKESEAASESGDDVSVEASEAPEPKEGSASGEEASASDGRDGEEPRTTAEKEPSQTPEPTPAPHVCSWDGGTMTQAATCSSEGVMTYTCTCGNTRTEAIAKTDHNYAWLWNLEEDLGNCTKRNRLVDICSNCGFILNTYSDTTYSAHDMDEGVSTGGPVCTSAVTWTYTCQNCDYITTQTIEPRGHVLESWGSGNCRFCGKHIEHQWVEGMCYCGAVRASE